MKLLLLAIFSHSVMSARAEEAVDFVRAHVDDASESLFIEARDFYAKLGSTDIEDISYISKRMIDVPEGKFGVTEAVRSTIYGTPKLMLISGMNISESKFGYIVCVIYPYPKLAGLETRETKHEDWIQGERRFDIWCHSENMWQVKLGVNIKKINNTNVLNSTFDTFDSSVILFDKAEKVVTEIEKRKKWEQVTNSATETAILEALKRNK